MTTPIRLMSRKQLEAQIRDAKNELNARRRADTSPEDMNATIRAYQAEQGREDGDEWEQPTNALDSYLKGAEVSHDGKRWFSTHDNNVHRPGESGWRLKPETDDEGNEIPPPFVAPSGSHDSYQQGEKITWSDGKVYRAVRSGVAHSPEEYPPDWELVEPPEDDGDEDDDHGDGEPEEEEPELPEWEPDGHQYQAGDTFTYGGSVYVVLQGHTSASHWTPPAVPALYERQG